MRSLRSVALFAILGFPSCANHGASPTVPPAARSQIVAQGNGSSGIGNLFPIVANLVTTMGSADAIQVVGDVIIDGKTGEKLLQIEPVSPPGAGANLVPAQLGRLKGFEYVPQKGSGEANYWEVCVGAGACYKLSPLSSTNSKVPAIIGALDKS